MSLVGTRPILQDELEQYELHHRARIATKPGITGMWQVSGRSNITDFEEVVRLDTEYITKWNFGLDMQNILCSSNDISSKAKNKMNHFYYAQCIASVERMVRKRKKRDTLMILNDSFFQNILQREKSAGRIHNLDYWLLKHKKGYIYCGIHRIYVRIKKLKEIVQ